MVKKMLGIILLLICAGSAFAGISLICNELRNQYIRFSSKNYTPTTGKIVSCVIKQTSSGSTPRKLAGGQRKTTRSSTYYHANVLINYEVDGSIFTHRILKDLYRGGYPSFEMALEAIQKIAPGQTVTWISYNAKYTYKERADFICSLKLNSTIISDYPVRYNPKNPHIGDLQTADFSWPLTVFGFACIIFAILMSIPCLHLLSLNGFLYVALITIAIIAWLPLSHVLSRTGTKLFKHLNEPFFSITIDENLQCDDVYKYVFPEKGVE